MREGVLSKVIIGGTALLAGYYLYSKNYDDAYCLYELAQTEADNQPDVGKEAVMLTALLRRYYARRGILPHYKKDICSVVYQKGGNGRYWYDGIETVSGVQGLPKSAYLWIKSFYDSSYNLAKELAEMYDDKMLNAAKGHKIQCSLFYKNDKIAPTSKMRNFSQRRAWQYRVKSAQIGDHSFYTDPKEWFRIQRVMGKEFCAISKPYYLHGYLLDSHQSKLAINYEYLKRAKLLPNAKVAVVKGRKDNYSKMQILQLMRKYPRLTSGAHQQVLKKDEFQGHNYTKLDSQATDLYRLRGIGMGASRSHENNMDYAILHEKARKVFDLIVKEFNKELRKAELPESVNIRLVINSLLRTPSVNKTLSNASQFSAHMHAMGIDISTLRFDILWKDKKNGEYIFL